MKAVRDSSTSTAPSRKFVIAYHSIAGPKMFVVEIGEPHGEWSRTIRAATKEKHAKRFSAEEAQAALLKVREVDPKAALEIAPESLC